MSDPKREINSAVFEGLNKRSDPSYLPILLDIRNSGIVWNDEDRVQEDGHLRLVNDIRGVKYKGDDDKPHYYEPCVFSVKLPAETGKAKGSASITVSALDGRLIETIRSVGESLKCRVVALYAKIQTEDGVQKYAFSKIYGREFYMKSVTWTRTSATWQLDPDYILDYNVPLDMANQFKFPGTGAS